MLSIPIKNFRIKDAKFKKSYILSFKNFKNFKNSFKKARKEIMKKYCK